MDRYMLRLVQVFLPVFVIVSLLPLVCGVLNIDKKGLQVLTTSPGWVQAVVTGLLMNLGFSGVKKIIRKLVEQPLKPVRFLGEGSAGVAYLVGNDITKLVRKILSEVAVSKITFEVKMEVLMRFQKHRNILAPKSYSYKEDGEKQIEYDYFERGSLMTLLHGNGAGRTRVHWETRVKIALGVAKGIAHIHAIRGPKFSHGNIKSSNILINHEMDGVISDMGLVSLKCPQMCRLAGYLPPEVSRGEEYTQASDIYSFGILLLELVSARHPLQNPGRRDMVDLTTTKWDDFNSQNYDPQLRDAPERVQKGISMMVTLALCCIKPHAVCKPKMDVIVNLIQGILLKGVKPISIFLESDRFSYYSRVWSFIC